MALTAVHEMLRGDLEKVEERLLQRTVNSYEFVDMAMRHVIEGGGKRLRPMRWHATSWSNAWCRPRSTASAG